MAESAARRYLAEFLGSFALLVFVGGAAVYTLGSSTPDARAILVSLAVGVAVLAGAFVFGPISGAHFNPAVTLSMAVARKMPLRDVGPYLVAQVLGGLVGMATVLAVVAGSSTGLARAQSGALASQCYAGSGAPPSCAFSLGSVLLLEIVLTLVFVLVIHRVTRPESGIGNFGPLAIGLVLAATNLIAIPVDGASINPVRSFAPALLSVFWPTAQWAIKESWAFWVAPVVGGLLAAAVDRVLPGKRSSQGPSDGGGPSDSAG